MFFAGVRRLAGQEWRTVVTIIFTVIAFLVLKYGLGLSYGLSVILTPIAFIAIMLVLLALPPYGKFK
jgi:hypothetical protein